MISVSLSALLLFAALWLLIRWKLTANSYYFDAQDTFRDNNQDRQLPQSAETATFEPMLKHYVGVTQLLVTVAAASIAFGGNTPHPRWLINIAKILLSWSIVYGLTFCGMLLWRYDQYQHDGQSYTRNWYAAVQASAFSTFICFIAGYLSWGWGLWRS